MVQYDSDETTFWDNVNKLSKNPERPRRNSAFLVLMLLAGAAGVVVFAVLAVVTLNSRAACPCTNPYKYLNNGERLLDLGVCEKDLQYTACIKDKNQRHTLFAGLAGGSAGLLLVALLLFRYG